MVDRSPLPCDANCLNAQKNGSARCGSESGCGRPRCGASSASTHTRSWRSQKRRWTSRPMP